MSLLVLVVVIGVVVMTAQYCLVEGVVLEVVPLKGVVPLGVEVVSGLIVEVAEAVSGGEVSVTVVSGC